MFETKKFGAYISKLRKKADITQSELAERLNLTRQAISKYECGDSFPDISILISISQIFDITLDELINSGNPTEKEAVILEKAAFNQDLSGVLNQGTIGDIINIAPLLKPSLLDKLAAGLGKQGIDISGVVLLAEYLQDETVIRLMEKASFDSLNEELLEKLIPFLDGYSRAAVFQKILDGELDYRFIQILLSYDASIADQVETAVLYGGLDEKALEILKDYKSGD